jgi:hypothetical protein
VLAFVVHGQPAAAWERRQYGSGRHQFALGAKLHYFANDRTSLQNMPTKLTYFAEVFRRRLPVPTRLVTLGRIKYGDNPHRWDPEPLAMERFSRMLTLKQAAACRVKVVTPAQLAAAGVKVAHLTGVDAAEEVFKDWDAIDAWVNGGGTLIVDQAGGPKPGGGPSFDSAFRKLLQKRYGQRSLEYLSSAHPFLAGLEKVGYRNVMGVRRKAMRPRLEGVRIGDRVAIIYSRYDLACGLLGNPNPLVAGADADAAYEIFSRLVLRAGGLKLRKADPKGP